MSIINPKKIFYNTAHSAQPPYIAGHSLEKESIAPGKAGFPSPTPYQIPNSCPDGF